MEAKSGLWKSPAWPKGSGQPDYLNAVVKGRFKGDGLDKALELLTLLHTIEEAHGRVRTIRNAARALDLDLLLFGDLESDSENLILPHPRMLERAFVLLPASEIDEKWLVHVDLLPEEDIIQTRYVSSW